MKNPTPTAVEDLKAKSSGRITLPEEGAYDASRKVFNGMINKKPAVIFSCENSGDVQQAIAFAKEYDLPVAVRGGGHSVGGKSASDGGLLIDLGGMKDIRVDPASRTAKAQPGLRLREFDQATQKYGLATTMGIVSDTGIAGLTLGGGVGWLNGKYGLACDNLIAAEVVTADGRLLKASPEENEELFWGIRGSGGNLGVVTSFEFRLHPVKEIFGGMLLYDIKDAREVLLHYDEYSKNCLDEVSTAAGFITSPEGMPLIAVLACHCGSQKQAEKDLHPLRAFGNPISDAMQPMEYMAMQQLMDDAFPPDRQHYWKSNFIKNISEEAIEILVDFALKKPSPYTNIVFQQLHGAATRVNPSATAFVHRDNQYDFVILSQWEDPIDAEMNITWTRELWEAMQPYTKNEVYINNLGEEGQDRVKASFGSNYERLKSLKQKYDPENFFRSNQNIDPV